MTASGTSIVLPTALEQILEVVHKRLALSGRQVPQELGAVDAEVGQGYRLKVPDEDVASLGVQRLLQPGDLREDLSALRVAAGLELRVLEASQQAV
jgi:hypothetical protein